MMNVLHSHNRVNSRCRNHSATLISLQTHGIESDILSFYLYFGVTILMWMRALLLVPFGILWDEHISLQILRIETANTHTHTHSFIHSASDAVHKECSMLTIFQLPQCLSSSYFSSLLSSLSLSLIRNKANPIDRSIANLRLLFFSVRCICLLFLLYSGLTLHLWRTSTYYLPTMAIFGTFH